MGVWTAPAPTCQTTQVQLVVATTPRLPQSSTSDGSYAIYLTSYVTSVDISCIINQGGRPELVANQISETSPRHVILNEVDGSRQMTKIRITSPVPSDGGTFTCVDLSRANEMHSIDVVFDDQRYALQDPCPSDITVPTDFNSTHTTVSWEKPSLVNNQRDIHLLSYYEPGNRFNLGKTDVVYNASDLLGMAEVCVFTITVEDVEPPTIQGCPDDMFVPTDPGRAMAQVSWVDPIAIDNSGQVDLATKAIPGTYYGIGSFTIAYTATDSAGNEATCSFSIMIEDREPPQVTCPDDIVVDTIPGASHSRATWSSPTVTDNSGRTIIMKDPGTDGVFIYGISNRTYSVRDGTGNIGNCTFTIQVRDSEPPRFMNCPRSIRRYIETSRENTTFVQWDEPIADDNVGISWPWHRSHKPGTRFAVGDHHVSYVVNDLAGNNVSCDFVVSVIEARCPSERTTIGGENFTWSSAMTSTQAESAERCPVNTAYGGHPVAVRYCQFDYTDVGIWQRVKIRTCGRDITPLDFRDLSMVPVSKYNVKEVAKYVEAVVVNQTEFEREDIMFLSDTLQNMADVESPSKTVSNAFVEIVGRVAESDIPTATREEVGHELGTILQALDRQIMESAHCDKTLNIATAFIAVRTASFRPDDVTMGLTFAPVTSDKDNNGGEGEEEEIFLRTIIKNDTGPMQKHLQMEASIQLPSEVFEVAFNGSAIPVSFVVYKDDTLFPSERLRRRQENYTQSFSHGTTWPPDGDDGNVPPQTPRITKVLGPVLSASVAGGMTIVNLNDPVVIEFGAEEGLNYSNIECVFWDFTLEQGRGDWSDKGCQFAGRRNDGNIICYCNHLTNFAVLVDIHGQLDINQKEKFALDLITRIGCFLSIAGLSFTILTFLLFKSLRTNRSRQILIHLCFALLVLYVVFICGIVATRIRYACLVVAALLHYLVLVTVMWMGVEARHMYVMLVKVFKSERSRFVIKAALIAWGIPVIPVTIAVGLSMDSYKNTAYCFLMPSHVMYYGLLLPIGVILLHNIITFSLAIRNLLCSDMSGNSVNKTKREQVISRLQNAVCMSVLLGLTWSFGFLAVGDASFAFRLLFCIFNSFQGFIIFALFCIRSKEVRSAWSSLSIIECNIRSQSYRVKEKSYHANSESAWNGPCVIDWGDAPGLDAYLHANKQRFRDSANSDESRIATYSVSASALNTNKINNGW
ncbi:adhesion G-protein coupled receptor G4-like [Lytechinus pictus]|uniref:adhesion G-protein coupled receptor G4-like n=1 Tax=Lytechinus pictus TaxID=7653 RepID=UPI0030B9F4F3